MRQANDNQTSKRQGLIQWLAQAANARLVALVTVLVVVGAMWLWPEGRTLLAGLGVVALATLRLLALSQRVPAPAPARARRSR